MSFFNTTLKRNSKLDLSRPDLLKLVSMLEGELQAREITIAVLKSEQIKRLLNPLRSNQPISGFKTTKQIDNCYSNNNQIELNAEQTIKYSSDPLIALSRDSLSIYEPSLDYTTTLALYNIKAFQLENLINNQRKLQIKTNDYIKLLEKQYENVLNELEDERRKNYDKNKNEFENNDHIKQETKIQELTKQLNETKDNMKKIILSLLNERKQLILRLIDEKHLNEQLEQTLTIEKGKMAEMVEGLEDESKRSLQMEAELEKYLNDFEKERQELHQKLEANETKQKELIAENDRLRNLVESLQAQSLNGKTIKTTINNNNNIVDQEKWNIGEGVRSSIVTTTQVGPKVQSFSSVNPVFHPKASVAQPIPPITTTANKTISSTILTTTTNATANLSSKSINTQDINLNNNNNTILPPPSIPVPQPKQSNHCIKNKLSSTNLAANNLNENNNDTPKSKQMIDTSAVKQTVMFYENSAKITSTPTTTTATTTLVTSSSTTTTTTTTTLPTISTTGTMIKKSITGQRPTPPPIPPNKPSIKPVLPHQALLSFNNKTNNKDSNAITNNNNNKINSQTTTTTTNKISNKINNNVHLHQQQPKQGTAMSLLKKFSFDGKSEDKKAH